MHICIERKGKSNMRISEENYVDKAERVIQNLVKESKLKNKDRIVIVTTSKIRNLLAMNADIYNQVQLSGEEELSTELRGRIEYLRVRFIYECGREPLVKNFVQKAEILEIIQEIGKTRKNYMLFSRYMEALVAFHRYYGGKDQ